MRARSFVIGCGLVVIWAVGIVEFPHALEPGWAERNGIHLPFHGVLLDGSGDWSAPSSRVRVATVSKGVFVEANAGAFALLSRTLAVFPETCYRIKVTASGTHGIGVEVLNAKRDKTLSPPRSVSAPVALIRFSSGRERRVVIAIVGTTGGTGTLEDAALERLGPSCSKAGDLPPV